MVRKNMNIGYKKKGNTALSIISLLLILFIFILFSIGAKVIFNMTNEDMQNDENIDQDVKDMVADQNDNYSSLFDGLFVFLFILLWGLVLVSAFMVDAHPIFFIFTVILLIFVFILSVYISNTYEEIMDDEDFELAESGFPMASYIFNNLLIFAIIIGFSVMFVLFAKNRM